MIKVVKIGGNVIDDAAALERFLTKFAALEGPKMLIHGGGKLATRLSAQLGIETQMIDGRRVTDRATLDVVTMVYAGLVNKQIVSMSFSRAKTGRNKKTSRNCIFQSAPSLINYILFHLFIINLLDCYYSTFVPVW